MLYSELDDNHSEVRKVEIYSDGQCDYADESESTGKTGLSTESIPSLSDIALDAAFEPVVISQEEFERVWAEAHR